MPFGVNPITGRPGPAPNPARDGDKEQARQRINVEVRTGRRPLPNDLPCNECGHLGLDRQHQYHHHLGYDAEHHLDVVPLCTRCHAKAEGKGALAHCQRGHEFTPDNTTIRANGTRECRECRRDREKKRPPRGSQFWRRVNANRRSERQVNG